MKKREVYIHQIQAPSSKNLLPLAAGLVCSYAKSIDVINNNYDFDINIIREDPNRTAERLADADVMAFSTYSWNFQQSLAVARKAKRNNPNLLVVFGGPMISLSQREEELNGFFTNYPYVDIVVHGMGEWPFASILQRRLENKSFQGIESTSYANKISDFGYISNPHSQENFRRDVNKLPSPFIDNTFDKILEENRDIISGTLWETNRGCPFSCSFCVQGDDIFNKVLNFSIERLDKELDWIGRNKIPYIFCTDANFGMIKRDPEIALRICETREKYGYPHYFMVNWGKNLSDRVLNVARILRKGELPGRMTLSRQSFNEDTLTAVRRKNIRSETYDDMKIESMKNNISSYTELILGLPEDSYGSFTRGLVNSFSKELGHVSIVYYCRLLGGTQMNTPEDREKYGMKVRNVEVGFGLHDSNDFGVSEFEEIIVGNKSLPIKDWRKAHTFTAMAISIFNYRLGFYVLNYLKDRYLIDYKDFFEYLICSAQDVKYPLLAKGLKTIIDIENSILYGKTCLKMFDFTGKVVYEFHEAALMIFLNEISNFYNEFHLLIKDYLCDKNIDFDNEVLNEIYQYQIALIPNWFSHNDSFSFKYNIPQYFQSLLNESKSLEIVKERTDMMVDDKIPFLTDPIKFSKKRLTVGMFRIRHVSEISTKNSRLSSDEVKKSTSEIYNNLEFI